MAGTILTSPIRLTSPFRAALVAGALSLASLGAMAAEPLRGIIDADTLAARLGEKSLVVIDIRSGETREKGSALFKAGHIPGAVHADYGFASWRLPRENISVYLPEPSQFEALAGDLGVSNESDVVIVHEGKDSSDFGGAARVYWSFKAMGHGSIAILDGGYNAWTKASVNKASGTKVSARPVATGDSAPNPTIYEAKPVPALRASLDEVLAASKAKGTLVDSRPASFYAGLEKHKAVQAFGHIPGAVNVPHSKAFAADNTLKDRAVLAKEFSAVSNAPGAIVYCNTGHWAATDWFVMSELLGQKDVKLYDGSMLDYSLEKRGPVSTAPSRSGS
jgi:thiosulfate/3-mercaptopyruvate sulfurtransferase